MAVRAVLFVVLCFSAANSEHVNRKYCQNVDPTKCSIHSVKLDPCPDGPGFCLMRRETALLRFHVKMGRCFEAQKLQLSLHSDDDGNGNFSNVIMPPHNACDHQTCPLEENIRTQYDVDFVFIKKTYGKFPIQMKLWNENNESEACCFTFIVKMLK